MADYLHAERPLILTTPLGPDVLLLGRIKGREAISHLFDFELEMLATIGTDVKFDQILGQSVTIEMRLADGDKRFFNGIVKRFTQGSRDERFVRFRAEMVPKVWTLTRKIRSRIFQHLSTPDILKQVFTGLDVSYKFLATYYPRDYCVQYRESDFDFASRLMEEEGIHYYFKHSDGSHQMVVSDSVSTNPPLPGNNSIIYDEIVGERSQEMRVTGWEKTQELRSGECTLWDHCFELPANHLEAKEKTIDTVKAGKIAHKLQVGGNDQFEIYDYPGSYAQRFDGIHPIGGARPEDLKHIFEDRDRTIRLRMEEEESAALDIEGVSDCGNFSPGHKFTLKRHFDADGKYLLTHVEHDARQSMYRAQDEPFSYENRFHCIPDELAFRPRRVTKKPVISSVQTATVVGPPGEEIFVDKYGRVKVQFHWDREGKRNADSSCWIRVAQVWAGKGWGGFFWPRIGHEVVVTFDEGDPDQPLIVGSVYNADNMPPFVLPLYKKLGGLKSATVHGSSKENFNGVVFYDEDGHEHLAIHSERHLSLHAEYDKRFHTGRHQGEHVPGAATLTVGRLPGSKGD